MAGTVEVGIGITVGIPTYGRLVSMGWANAWKQLNPPINYNIRFGQINNRLIADARNELADMAVKNGSRYLLFIGDDVIVPPYTMQKMVFRMENFPNLGVVGGIYCSKSDVPAPLVFRENGRGPYWKWKVGEFFEVTGLGMDCTMIRTDVFRELDPPWFKTVNEDDYEEAVSNAESWTEDIWFCTRVIQETDWKIYADAGVMCEHWDFARNMKFTLPWDSYPMQRVENPKKMVDLGCGKVVWDFEGEGTPLRVDIREETDPDYRCDLRDLPFADDQFSVTFSSHCAEHFNRHEVGDLLKEWIRITEPGGELRLCVPNLKWAAKNILENEDGNLDVNTLNVLYGSQDYPENFHKFGFTPESLKKMLEDRKMEVVETNLDGFHILIRARKPEKEDTEVEVQTDAEFEEGSEKSDNHYEEHLENLTGDDPKEVQPVPLQLRDTIKMKDPSKILGSGGPKRRNLRGKEI